MEEIIQLTAKNIDSEHICCAISDKKCKESYQAKKSWLRSQFKNGYIVRRINARAKVFIEYGPAENAFLPINADNYLNINCFWVSGKYKGNSYAKKLLAYAIEDAIKQNKDGLVTVVGIKKLHFMSDTKWLLHQGFVECERLNTGFIILVKKLNIEAKNPSFKESVKSGECKIKKGLVAYFSNRCPFAEYHVHKSLVETAQKRNIPLQIIKLDSIKKAQSAPSPATIFSLFYEGKFLTNDISACMDSRFDKMMNKKLNI